MLVDMILFANTMDIIINAILVISIQPKNVGLICLSMVLSIFLAMIQAIIWLNGVRTTIMAIIDVGMTAQIGNMLTGMKMMGAATTQI